MSEILKILSSNPTVLIVAFAVFCFLLICVVVVFIIALYQGREVSLWHLKVGAKSSSDSTSQTKKSIQNVKVNQTESNTSQNETTMGCPLKIFPASKTPIPEFNNFVNLSISKSTFYNYKGDKGLYLSYRLSHEIKNRMPGLKIDLLLLDITDIELYKYRAKELIVNPRYKEQTVEKLSLKLRKELLAAIVAFNDMKDQYNFEISFYSEVAFMRYEIMDELLIVSFLSMQNLGYYPPTLVYSKESVFYPSFLSNFFQIKQQSKNNLVLTHDNISEEVIMKLATHACIDCTIEELRDLYKNYYSSLS